MTDDDKSRIGNIVVRAEGYFELRMFEDAWRELETLPRWFQGYVDVIELRFRILLKLREYLKASYLGESYAKLRPESNTVVEAVADCYLRCGRNDEARDLVTLRMKTLGESASFLLLLVRAEALAGRSDEAKAALRQMMRQYPETKLMAIDTPELGDLL